MKNSTLYITGKPRSYFEPELTILATKRIETGKALLKELATLRDTATKKELAEHIVRYTATQKSIQHWVEILEEE